MTAPVAYLDYNASAPLLPEAAAAMTATFALAGNPSSVHRAGRAARAVIEDAREAVAALVKVTPAQVVFTSGATEANGLALAAGPVTAAAVEHPSVLAWAEAATIPVDADGIVDLPALENRLREFPPAVVALMLANNETGVLQPVTDAAGLAHGVGARLHCDAVQGPGRVLVNFQALGADTMSLSAHKFGGPKGVGALILRPGLELSALVKGGGQERRRRAGTENLAGIAGFGAAAKIAVTALDNAHRIAALRDVLEARIADQVPQARVLGQGVARLGNTSCIVLPGVPAETQLMRLDLANVQVSAGSACSSGKIAASHVLTAMGASEADAKCAIRVSFGPGSTVADIDAFFSAWLPLALTAAA
ncbi:MAG: cysteine desulfurase [Rhodospirillaceae bacterium]|nr:cysteine desulfurase [Rhodospirillaceae bacterium]